MSRRTYGNLYERTGERPGELPWERPEEHPEEQSEEQLGELPRKRLGERAVIEFLNIGGEDLGSCSREFGC